MVDKYLKVCWIFVLLLFCWDCDNICTSNGSSCCIDLLFRMLSAGSATRTTNVQSGDSTRSYFYSTKGKLMAEPPVSDQKCVASLYGWQSRRCEWERKHRRKEHRGSSKKDEEDRFINELDSKWRWVLCRWLEKKQSLCLSLSFWEHININHTCKWQSPRVYARHYLPVAKRMCIIEGEVGRDNSDTLKNSSEVFFIAHFRFSRSKEDPEALSMES